MRRFSDLLEDFFYRPDEDVSALLPLTTAVEDVAAAPLEETAEEHLAFLLDDEAYALPIPQVREILKVPPLTEVPRAAASLLGVMNLRGEVLPVYDIKGRLGLRPRDQASGLVPTALPRTARVVLVRDPEGDAGVLVDAVRAVVRLRPSALEPPPLGLSSERSCILGLSRAKGDLYILIDIRQALG